MWLRLLIASLFLSAWSCLAQLPVVPLQVFTPAAQILNPTNVSSKMFIWLVSRDMAAGVTVSNQWLDRIQSQHMWQMNTALSPTNNITNGVRFNGSQSLTNSQGASGWDIGNLTPNTAGDTFYFVFIPDSSAGEQQMFTDQSLGNRGPGMNAANLRYTGNASGGPNTICALPSGSTNDVLVTLSTTNSIWWTNGVLALSNSRAGIVDDFGYLRMGIGGLGNYKGYILENGIYTNIVFNINNVSNLHKYLTNTYGYKP